MNNSQSPKPTLEEQLDTCKSLLREFQERCDRAYASCDRRGVEIARLRAELARVKGEVPCPGCGGEKTVMQVEDAHRSAGLIPCPDCDGTGEKYSEVDNG